MNLFGWLKQELTKNAVRKTGAWLAREAFRSIKRRVDPDSYGGAPLLGLNGNVTIVHGSAREFAIKNAIRYTSRAFHSHINQTISGEIARATECLARQALVAPASS